MVRGVVLLVALVAGLVACSGEDAELPEGTYRVVGLEHDRRDHDDLLARLERPVTVDVTDGRITGHAGCNQYDGEVDSQDGELRLGPFQQTLMGCSEPYGSLESDFLAAAGAVRLVEHDGDRLVLTGGGSRIVLEETAGALTGAWRLVRVEASGVRLRTEGPWAPTLTFTPVQQAISGCQVLVWTTEQDGHVLALADLEVGQMRSCPFRGADPLAGRYAELLRQVTSFERRGGTLVLRGAQVALHYEIRDP